MYVENSYNWSHTSYLVLYNGLTVRCSDESTVHRQRYSIWHIRTVYLWEQGLKISYVGLNYPSTVSKQTQSFLVANVKLARVQSDYICTFTRFLTVH